MTPSTPSGMFSPTLERALADARHVVVLTGAGVSAESGVPTFRARDGLWARYDPTQLATREAFEHDPELVWRWYSWRRTLIRGVQPNPGHYALAEMESLFPRFSLVTQNVDSLHRRAGNREVHELHGNIEHSRCIRCARPYHGDDTPPTDTLPYCSCGGAIRPGVVWFGEALPENELRFAESAAGDCDLFLSVGTSGLVYPAAGLPRVARQAGAFVVEINPEPGADAASIDESISGPSGVVLPLLLDTARRLRNSA